MTTVVDPELTVSATPSPSLPTGAQICAMVLRNFAFDQEDPDVTVRPLSNGRYALEVGPFYACLMPDGSLLVDYYGPPGQQPQAVLQVLEDFTKLPISPMSGFQITIN